MTRMQQVREVIGRHLGDPDLTCQMIYEDLLAVREEINEQLAGLEEDIALEDKENKGRMVKP